LTRRVARDIAVLVGFLTLALLMFHATWAGSPSRSWIGVNGDPQVLIWFLQWSTYAWSHGLNPLLTHHINFPGGVNLMWNTAMPLPSLLLYPVTRWFGPTLSFNLLVTAGVAGSGWCAYLVISHHVKSTAAAVVGGLAYGSSQYVLGQAYGHLNLVFVLTPPLVLWLLDEILVRQRWSLLRGGVCLGVVVAAQLLISEEILASEALAGSIAAVLLLALYPREARSRWRRALGALVIAGATAGAIAAGPLATRFLGPGRIAGGRFQPPDVYVSDIWGFIVPTFVERLAPSSLRAVSSHFTGNGLEWNAYVGVPLLVAVGIVAVRGWRVPLVRVSALLAAALAVLSLGPHLHVEGHVTAIPLPWAAIHHVPIAEQLLPGRLMVHVDLLLALLLALFVDSAVMAGTGWARPASALLTVAVIASLFPRLPYPSTTPTVPAFFRDDGRRLPSGAVALVAPYANTPFNVDPMLWQVSARMRFRMPEGYYIGPDASGRPMVGPEIKTISMFMLQIEQGAPSPALDPQQRAQVVGDLASWRVNTVIVGPMKNQGVMVRFFESVLRSPPTMTGGVAVWPRIDVGS